MFCSCPDSLVSYLVSQRDMNADTSDVHIGIDGGQGMLKVGLTVTDRGDRKEDGRSKYSEVSNYFYQYYLN